ncbi:MAG TPA: signal peptidase II [Candidatus Latescibacteria bacterium]|nr:signal peptidase II [Candidatus Latescibacterota bacterium]
MVSTFMSPGDSMGVLGSFLRLTYVHNPYAAFGIAIGPPKLYFVFSSVALGVVIWALLHAHPGLPRHALALVSGGALGNMVDRLRMGQVVDFLDLGVGPYRWPVFNVADLAVTTGVALLIWRYVGRKDRG